MRIVWEPGDRVQIRDIPNDTLACTDAVVTLPEADGYISVKEVATGLRYVVSSKCVEPRDTPQNKAASDYLSRFPPEARAYCLRAYEDGFLDGVLESVEP